MSERVAWRAGAPAVRAALERWLAGECAAAARPLRDNARRYVVRADLDGVGPVLIKRFRTATGRHPGRERIKTLLGLAGARREWRALRALREAGVAVPEPLALGVLASGDRLLAMRFLRGTPLRDADLGRGTVRRRALREVGALVGRLHAAGIVHNDLHPDNVLWSDGAPVLVDLQHTRRARGWRARRRDLGRLDYALGTRGFPAGDRTRVIAACLGVSRPFDAAARWRLREVAAASRARAVEHAGSRTRRALRPGRRFARAEAGRHRGLRLRRLDPALPRAALAAHLEALARDDGRVIKSDSRSRITSVEVDGRPVIVKEVLPRGPWRILADGLRGSPAQRAWRAGHGLRARGVDAATPFAFLERRRLGLPVGSLVVLEDVRPARPADEAARDRGRGEALGDVLRRLLVALHRRGVDHGDLKASHVFVELPGVLAGPNGAGGRARLIDLEGVHFRRRLPARRRIRALAELNASLPDELAAPVRCRTFSRYARALPFAGGAEAALARVVRLSLARGHRWSGADCALAARPAPHGVRERSAPAR